MRRYVCEKKDDNTRMRKQEKKQEQNKCIPVLNDSAIAKQKKIATIYRGRLNHEKILNEIEISNVHKN